MSRSDTFTRWAVVSSGEGGGRVTADFFARTENPGIDDRMILLNTNRADIRNTIEGSNVPETLAEKAVMFGSKRGVGNSFVDGRQCAQEDIGDIVSQIENDAGNADAFLYLTTLGGGTGNGSIPYLVNQFGDPTDIDDQRAWMRDGVHITFGIWPYYNEAIQQQFNAVCGLSRLLCREDNSQNADMVLLAANSHIEGDDTVGGSGEYELVNERIVEAVDLLISAGRETQRVIDVEDYVAQPSNISGYHFTPAVTTDENYQIRSLEHMFDRASEATYVPMDVETCRAAYAIVRAPEHLVGDELTTNDVKQAFDSWKRKHGLTGTVGMETLTPKRATGNGVDVLLLLGGFDLNPLVDHAWDQYESHRENLAAGRRLGNERIPKGELDTIEENLRQYMKVNE